MTPRLLFLVLACVAAVPAAAQQRTAPFETAPAAPLLPADPVPDTVAAKQPMPRRERLAVRTAGGGLGWVVGALAGAAAGFALARESEDDAWDLSEPVYGGAIGGVVGGAAGAAIPSYRGECGLGARFGRGLLGSALGTVVGLAVATSADDAWSGLAVPIAGGLGAALAADC